MMLLLLLMMMMNTYHAIILNHVLTSRITAYGNVETDLRIRDCTEEKSFKYPGWHKVAIYALSADSETFSDVTAFEVHSVYCEVAQRRLIKIYLRFGGVCSLPLPGGRRMEGYWQWRRYFLPKTCTVISTNLMVVTA